MSRRPLCSSLLAALPLRWRLALVSFGLLALLLVALSIVISTTEEQTLLTSQADVLRNEGRIAQMQMQATETPLTEQEILTFPGMSKDLSISLANSIQVILGQGVGVSLLSFDGSVLAMNTQGASGFYNSTVPVVTLAPSRVQSWLLERSSTPYLLTTDSQGQRELVMLLPVAGWDKSVQLLKESPSPDDLSGYRKALLQISVPTTAIDQAVKGTRLVLTLGVLVALCLASALTLPLINLALRPLVEMEKVSTHIAAGALDQRLAEPASRDEIGRLARAFNYMVARLETAFAQQKRFVADVSHELRTPLTGLGGSLEVLLLGADNGDEETTRKLMNGMYVEVERMQRLVADLLALTRLDEGKLKPRVEEIAVALFIEAICCQVQGMINGQCLSYQVSPSIPALWGDGDQMRRVLLNILENALKFTPPGGRIDILVSNQDEERITLEVRDTGIGIAPEDLPRVCDRFYRADASRTRQAEKFGGSGLGLSLARELIEAHHGTISISSTLGQGTTVTLKLPARSWSASPMIDGVSRV